MSRHAALCVFLKPVTRGKVKTRLAAVLGVEDATRLYEAFVKDTIDHVRAVPSVDVVVWVSGAIDDPDLSCVPPELARRAQPETSLGGRMLCALSEGINTHGRALVVGTDAPTLGPHLLERSLHLLREVDVVFVPSADGGYAAIAARRVHPHMFDGVRMSTEHALFDTCDACSRAGLSWALTEPWFDVDTTRDLWTLDVSVTLDPGRAPHTLRALRTVADTRF